MTRRRRLLDDSHVLQVDTAKGRNMWGPTDIAIRRRVVAAGPYLTSKTEPKPEEEEEVR